MKNKMKCLALVLALVLSVNCGFSALATEATPATEDESDGSSEDEDTNPDSEGESADEEGAIAVASDDSEDEDESADSEDTGSGDTVYTAADDEDDGEDEDDADSNGDLYNADFYTATEIGDFSGDLTKTTTASSDLLSWGWLYGEDVTTETELYAEGYAFELEGGVTYEIYVSVDDEDDYNLIGLLLDETFTYIYFNFSGQGDYVTFYVPEDATYYLYLSNAYELNHVNYTGYIGEVASTEIEEEGEVLAVLWTQYMVTTWDEVDSLTVSDFYEVGNYLGTISGDLDMDIVVVSVEDDGGNLTGDADLMIGAEGLNLGSHVIYGEEGTYIDVMGSGTLTAGGVEAYSFCVDPGSAVQISGDLNTDRDAGFINYGTVTVSGDLTAGTCYNDGGSLTVSGSVFYDDWFGCYGTDVTVGGDIIEEDDGDGYYNTMEIFDSSSATVGGSVDVWAVGVVGESTLTVSGDVTATDSICVGESEYDVDECVLTVGGDATVTGGDNCDWGSMQVIAGSTVFIGGDVYVAESLRLEPGESDEAARVIIGSEISGLDTTATQSYISINGRTVDAAEIDTSRFSEEEAIHLNNAYVTFHDSELGNDSDHGAYTHDLYVYGTSVLDGTFSGGFNFRGGTVMQMSYEGDETSLTDDENVEWIRYTAYELASKLSVTLAAYTTYTVNSAEKNADISFWTDADADDLVVWLPTDAVLKNASSNIQTRVEGISGVTADIPASVLLSDADRELLARGYSIAFVLTVNDHNATVSDEDKALIAALTDSVSTYYMDITLSKQVMDPSGILNTDYTISEITEISSNITITILIPDTMQTTVNGKSGNYGAARVHDGAAAMLTTIYAETEGTIAFETDCFSTYALTFTEETVDSSTTATTTTATPTAETTSAEATEAAKTGDTNPVNLYLILIAVCMAGLIGAAYSRKRNVGK